VPQLKGAGLTLAEVTGAPYWVGVVVGRLVAPNVGLGGMRGITYVQAFQYWVKVFAIAVPACVLLVHLGGLPERAALFGASCRARPPRGSSSRSSSPTRVTFPRDGDVHVDGGPAARPRGGRGDVRTLPAGALALPAGTTVPVAEGIEPQAGATGPSR
jgi:hypothetical protein